ncbi:hypothetical protein SISSUDRAFT_1036279 [Sistotremastrum suecicum HHB10207 ss-3]|uniref:Uncharacterized protein n=1 Tax=Sistotremastrum suecicum HHB10207 ss-3 TaxID=1314776 RepID=A0A165ZN32_9AGAM|nr:hypothetical protein SISSUDRAFT_1036279 [Sistotremastrum suecicum HHB10207 ss-3]
MPTSKLEEENEAHCQFAIAGAGDFSRFVVKALEEASAYKIVIITRALEVFGWLSSSFNDCSGISPIMGWHDAHIPTISLVPEIDPFVPAFLSPYLSIDGQA